MQSLAGCAAVLALLVLRSTSSVAVGSPLRLARAAGSTPGVCSGRTTSSGSATKELEPYGVILSRTPIVVYWLLDNDALPDQVLVEADTTRTVRRGPPAREKGVTQISPSDGSFTPAAWWRNGSLLWFGDIPARRTVTAPGIRVTVKFGAGGFARFRVPLPVEGSPVRVVEASTPKRNALRLTTAFSNGEAGWLNVLASTTTFRGCRATVGPVSYSDRI